MSNEYRQPHSGTNPLAYVGDRDVAPYPHPGSPWEAGPSKADPYIHPPLKKPKSPDWYPNEPMIKPQVAPSGPGAPPPGGPHGPHGPNKPPRRPTKYNQSYPDGDFNPRH